MKKLWWILIVLLVAAVLVAAWLLFDSAYVILNYQIVERSAQTVILTGADLPDDYWLKKLNAPQTLDVRQIPLAVDRYEALQALFPNTQVLYTLRIGGTDAAMDAKALTLSDVTEDLPQALSHLPGMEKITFTGTGVDPAKVYELMQAYSAITFDFAMDVQGVASESGAKVLDLTGVQVDTESLELTLSVMPNLQRLVVPECEDYEWLLALKESRPELEVYYKLTVCGTQTDTFATELTVADADAAALKEALPHLKALKTVNLTGSIPEDADMLSLIKEFEQVDFLWDLTVCGVEANTGDKELILSNTRMSDTLEVEQKLGLFANLERVEMCYCGIPSSQMDVLCQTFPDIRFVWAVRVGTGYLRTDAEAFIPYKIGYDIDNPLYDADCQELKYCTDLICLDLGHMRMQDVSFLNNMPKMQYLVLGDTVVRDFTPIKGLTELVYLEIFKCGFSDHSMLLGMTKLKDLNIGFTPAYSVETLKQMTWLERLWMPSVPVTTAEYNELVAALPNTQVVRYVAHSTAGNWRDNDNYRDMRDLLGMYYME